MTLTFVLAHNILYTNIAPFLAPLGLSGRVDVALLIFGLASLVSIVLTGLLVDRHLRALTITASVLFAAATFALGVLSGTPALVYLSAVIWGLGFGGAATLLQTASAEAAWAAGDVAQSLIVTCWNSGIAAGAAVGGVLLTAAGTASLPWWTLALVLVALAVTTIACQHGFPAWPRRLVRGSEAAAPQE